MSDTDKIYADASQPATLRHAGSSVHCHTLQEAVLAWMRLSVKDREQATIRADDGTVYTASEIDRLHMVPKPYTDMVKDGTYQVKVPLAGHALPHVFPHEFVRLVLTGVLLLAVSALSGCSSTPSVPSWAVAMAQSQYLREKRIAQRLHQEKMQARLIVGHPAVDGPKVDNPKVGAPKADDDVRSTGTVPSKYGYLYLNTLPSEHKHLIPFSKEWQRREDEEDRGVKAAITICRGC